MDREVGLDEALPFAVPVFVDRPIAVVVDAVAGIFRVRVDRGVLGVAVALHSRVAVSILVGATAVFRWGRVALDTVATAERKDREQEKVHGRA